MQYSLSVLVSMGCYGTKSSGQYQCCHEDTDACMYALVITYSYHHKSWYCKDCIHDGYRDYTANIVLALDFIACLYGIINTPPQAMKFKIVCFNMNRGFGSDI